jgi:transcriptional regulator with XRE-family HTH domain
MTDFSRNMEIVRKDRGISRADLAAQAGVAEKTLYNAATGRGISMATAAKIADALGVGLADLIAPENEPHRPARTVELVG